MTDVILTFIAHIPVFADVFLELWLLTKACKYKDSIKHPKLWFVLFIIVFTPVIILFNFLFHFNIMVYFIIGAAVGILFGAVFLKNHIYPKIIIVLTFLIITALMRFLMTNLFNLFSTARAMSFTDFMSFTGIIYMALNIIVTRFMASHLFTLTFQIPAEHRMTTLLSLLFSFTSIIILSDLDFINRIDQNIVQRVLIICIFFNLLMIYYMFTLLLSGTEEAHRLRLLNQHLSTQEKHAQEIEYMYDSVRLMRHELKNKLFCMNAMLQSKDYDGLQDYFTQMYQNEYNIDLIDSGNNMINAVLNHKQTLAEANGIPLKINTSIPDQLDLDLTLLCALVSNILDNAIEASKEVPDAEVIFSFNKVKSFLILECKNKVTENVLIHNPSLKTTKKNKTEHGLGMQVIKNVTNQCNGTLDITCENNYFTISLMLKGEQYNHNK